MIGSYFKHIQDLKVITHHSSQHSYNKPVYPTCWLFSMIYEINKDLKKSYFSSLFSPNIDQWLVREKEENEQLIRSGSYGKVYLVQLGNGIGKKAAVQKITSLCICKKTMLYKSAI